MNSHTKQPTPAPQVLMDGEGMETFLHDLAARMLLAKHL